MASSSTTLVILSRHAEREFIIGKADWEQPLTQKGFRTAHALGMKLQQAIAAYHGNSGDSSSLVRIIFCSPMLRSIQTANLLANALHPKAGIHQVEELSPGGDKAVRWALNTITANLGSGCLILVGHKPELTEICRQLYTGPLVQLKEGEAVAFELDLTGTGFWQVGSGKLLWKIKG